MYKNSKPKRFVELRDVNVFILHSELVCVCSCRDDRGHIVKAAPFQERLPSGSVARIEPNRKWFGKSIYVVGSHGPRFSIGHVCVCMHD